MSVPAGLISHAQKVCRAYKKALRELRNYYYDPHHFRYHATILRSKFDKNKDIKDIRVAKKLLLDLQDELCKWEHPLPMKFPDAPGGISYLRDIHLPDYVLDLWHPMEKQCFPKYFATREKRKKEYAEFYYKQFPDMKNKPKSDH